MGGTLLSVVWFSWHDTDYPALAVSGGPDRYGREQVVVNVRSGKQLHLTIHDTGNGGAKFTLQSADKPPSVWSDYIRQAAAAQGWNPEQHARYYVQQDLDIPLVGLCGREMAAVRVYLDRVKVRERYSQAPALHLVAPAEQFMVTVGISRLAMKCACSDASRHVPTAFGDLCFRTSA